MQINYQLTKDDYIAFNMHHMNYSPTFKKSIFIQRYIVSIIFLLVPFILKDSSDIPFLYWLSVFAIVYIAWVAFYDKYLKWNVTRKISQMIDEGKNTDMLGERSLQLTECGILQTSSLSESKITWDVIEDVVETKEHIFIYINALSGYVIPIRAFANAAQKDEFLGILKSHLQK